MKKSIKQVLILLVTLLATKMEAQNPTMILAPGFLPTSPPIQPLPIATGGYDGLVSYGPSNMYAGLDGNPLLFAVVDTTTSLTAGLTTIIYNKHGHKIADLCREDITFNDATDVISNNETVIVPDPGNCERYYVFGTANFKDYEQPGPTYYDYLYQPYYALIDMSLQTPGAPVGETGQLVTPGATSTHNIVELYDLVPNNNYGLPPLKSSLKLAVTKPRVSDGNSRLVFVFNDQYLIIFKVTTTGVQYLQMIEMAVGGSGPYYGVGTASWDNILGEMEIYESGNTIKFALPADAGSANGQTDANLSLFDLDISSFPYTVSNIKEVPVSISSPYTYVSQIGGIEFSPNGQYVYFTHEPNAGNPNPVEWVEYATISNRGAITPSGVTMTDFQRSHIELGLDGKMYFVTSNRLAAITNPNSPGSYSWTNTAVSLSSYPTYQDAYLLPDQMDQDTYGGFYENTVECCKLYTHFNVEKQFIMPTGTYTVGPTFPQTVNGTDSQGNAMAVTFDATSTAKADIIVPIGAKVTFRDITIKFTPEAGLTVKSNAAAGQQGGKVVLNASTLTWYTDCDENLPWKGVYLEGEALYAQGSTSSCQSAVLTTVGVSQIDHALTALYIDQGAIVQFTGGSKLLDNKVAIEANAYAPGSNPTNDVSIFNNCIIKTQSTSTVYPDNTSGEYLVRITGREPTMRFTNCTIKNEKTSLNNLYDGVVSNDSRVYLSGCLDISNLRHGVKHTNTLLQQKLTSYGCIYINNQIGILVSNSNFASINQNDFKLLSNPASAMYGVGLYLDQSSKFTVTTNEFYNLSYPAGTYSSGTIGIVANNTNLKDSTINIIRENTFYNLSEGAQNLNKNFIFGGTPINDQGLRYYCNSFVSPVDWCDIGVHTGAIDYHQGRGYYPIDSAASNRFSHTTSIDFYYNAWGTPTTAYTYTTTTIDYYYDSTMFNGKPNVPTGYYVSAIKASGNANNCAGGGPGAKLTENNTDPASLVERIEELDQSIAQVKSENSGASASAQISSLKAEMNQLEIALINYYLEDTTVVSGSDSALKYMIQFEVNTPYKGNLVSLYLQQGNVSKAQKVYNQIVADQAGSNYQKIYGVVMELYGKDIQRELVTNTQLFATVNLIATDESDMRAYLMAQSLLNMIGLKTYQEPIMSLQSTSLERKSQEVADQIKTVYNLSNFPNPFNGSTTLTAFVPKGSASATIVIIDLLGKEVAKYNLSEGNNTLQFDKQDVSGVMFYTLFIDGKRVESKMMVKN